MHIIGYIVYWAAVQRTLSRIKEQLYAGVLMGRGGGGGEGGGKGGEEQIEQPSTNAAQYLLLIISDRILFEFLHPRCNSILESKACFRPLYVGAQGIPDECALIERVHFKSFYSRSGGGKADFKIGPCWASVIQEWVIDRFF